MSTPYDGNRIHKFLSASQAEFEVRGNYIYRFLNAGQPLYEIRGNYIHE